jgi:hypothetical protein
MSDTLWIVRTAGSSVQTIKEDVARERHAATPGSTLSRRPFPLDVRLPYIGKDDYAFGERDGVDSCTHVPTGVTGWADDRRDAYKQMLRALHDHFERKSETLVSSTSTEGK